jgi:hypothetical protein
MHESANCYYLLDYCELSFSSVSLCVVSAALTLPVPVASRSAYGPGHVGFCGGMHAVLLLLLLLLPQQLVMDDWFSERGCALRISTVSVKLSFLVSVARLLQGAICIRMYTLRVAHCDLQ